MVQALEGPGLAAAALLESRPRRALKLCGLEAQAYPRDELMAVDIDFAEQVVIAEAAIV